MMMAYHHLPKRVLDLCALIVLALPALLIIVVVAALVRRRLGTPVFFSQPRAGYRERTFRLIKFRTMSDERDANGMLLPDEQRLGAFGKFLRATSLDELPTFWNVLKGEMSLVGPRPLLLEYLPLYDKVQRRRHEVRPGITGWAQVNGRNAISWAKKFEYDVWYVDNVTLLLDVQILFLTVAKVAGRKNIAHPGAETMPPFSGT